MMSDLDVLLAVEEDMQTEQSMQKMRKTSLPSAALRSMPPSPPRPPPVTATKKRRKNTNRTDASYANKKPCTCGGKLRWEQKRDARVARGGSSKGGRPRHTPVCEWQQLQDARKNM